MAATEVMDVDVKDFDSKDLDYEPQKGVKACSRFDSLSVEGAADIFAGLAAKDSDDNYSGPEIALSTETQRDRALTAWNR